MHVSAHVLVGVFFSSLLLISGAHAQDKFPSRQPPDGPLGSLAAERLAFMNTNAPWKTWVLLPIVTHHFDRQAVITDNLSESNPGLGFERSNGRWHLMAGAFRNSIRQVSAYGMVGFTPLQFDLPLDSNLAFGGALGLLTGYQNTQKGYPIVPAGGALISWETPHHVGVNIFLVPTLKSFQVEGFVAAQIKFSF